MNTNQPNSDFPQPAPRRTRRELGLLISTPVVEVQKKEVQKKAAWADVAKRLRNGTLKK